MTKLKRFQKRGVRLIEKFWGRCLLADEMGLGKTIQVVEFIRRNGIRPVLIICPAHLKYHWQNELRHHGGLYSEVIEGRRVPKGGLTRRRNILIINYDILVAWRKFLRKFDPELVVIDEAQYIKSLKAKRSQMTHILAKRAPLKIAISGTPLTTRPADLWSVLYLLWPKKYKNFWKFAHTHCNPRLRRWGWTFPGAKNLDVLHRNLKRLGMIRRLKVDVLPDLPKLTRTLLDVEINNRREYREAENEFRVWLRRNFSPGKVRRAVQAEMLVKSGYLKRLAAKGKLPSIFEWIDDFLEGSNGKLIVFAIHKTMIDALMERYGKIAVKIDGRVTGRKRQTAVDTFSKNKKCRILFGNIQAAGTGWNGTAAATTLIVEYPWVPAELTQAEARMDRIGQKFPMNSYLLIARNTIEEKIVQLLEERQKVLSAILDGDERKVALNIIDQLMRSLMRKKTA